MKIEARLHFIALFIITANLFHGGAWAATQTVTVNSLNFDQTLSTPFNGGDTLMIDTLIAGPTGALSESITFSVGAGVDSAIGFATWQTSPLDVGPLLISANIDVLDSSNNPVFSDTFAGVNGGFATSTLDAVFQPGGTYKLIATGIAVRQVVFDISLDFASSVPEPATLTMLLGGLGLVGFALIRRRAGGTA